MVCVFSQAHAAPEVNGGGRARFSWEAVNDPIVSGYRIYWGTASRAYPVTVDAGNNTEVIASGFLQGVKYYSACTAYAATGEESDYSEEIEFVYDLSDRLILLEAEAGAVVPPAQTGADTEQAWVMSPGTGGTVTLAFSTPYYSKYRVWCRVIAPSAATDELGVAVDQEPEQPFYAYGRADAPAESYVPHWTWRRIDSSPGVPREFGLPDGSHTLTFRWTEDMWLDRVVVLNNPFVPDDTLPRDGDVVIVTAQPAGRTAAPGTETRFAPDVLSTAIPACKWYRDNVLVQDGDMPLLIKPVEPSDAGDYKAVFTLGAVAVETVPARLVVSSAKPSMVTGVSVEIQK